MLEVCLLGTGGMMPLPGRPLSTVAFRVGSETVLFDCGEGTQVNWRSSDFNYRQTGTILISHVHADHIMGLPGVLFQISFAGRKDPVTIIGPKWTREVVSHLVAVTGRLPFEVRLAEIEPGDSFAIGEDMVVSTMLLEHNVPCLAYVIDVARAPRFNPDQARALGVPIEHWKTLQSGSPIAGFKPEQVSGPPRRGIRLALVTDTSYVPAIAEFVAGADLLVCEGMFAEDSDEERARERGHMTFRQAATIARDGNVDELWLTHFSPMVEHPDAYLDQTQQVFPGTVIGEPGMRKILAFQEEG